MRRAPGVQREYESRAAVNTVVLHPNQVLQFFFFEIFNYSVYKRYGKFEMHNTSIISQEATLKKLIFVCSH